MTFAQNRGITGASGALPIWAKVMVAASSGKPFKDFPIPEGIRFERVNIHTGLRQEENTKENPSLKVALTEDSLADMLIREEESLVIEEEKKKTATDEIDQIILNNATMLDVQE